jgi:hypothetical protein
MVVVICVFFFFCCWCYTTQPPLASFRLFFLDCVLIGEEEKRENDDSFFLSWLLFCCCCCCSFSSFCVCVCVYLTHVMLFSIILVSKKEHVQVVRKQKKKQWREKTSMKPENTVYCEREEKDRGVGYSRSTPVGAPYRERKETILAHLPFTGNTELCYLPASTSVVCVWKITHSCVHALIRRDTPAPSSRCSSLFIFFFLSFCCCLFVLALCFASATNSTTRRLLFALSGFSLFFFFLCVCYPFCLNGGTLRKGERTNHLPWMKKKKGRKAHSK